MAMTCVTLGRECDGCMSCEREAEAVGICEACREEIRAGEDYYDIEGDLLHEDCLLDWAWKYKAVST